MYEVPHSLMLTYRSCDLAYITILVVSAITNNTHTHIDSSDAANNMGVGE